MTYIGQPVKRVDAVDKVTGKALYPGDINYPDQVYMKVLFANRPHAVIHSIDTTKAESIPGVLAVFTAKDVPVNEYGLIVPDQPVLCGPGSSKPYANRVRYIGDQIALIVAESEDIATRARDAIEVVFEDLPVISDVIAAMSDDGNLLHPDRGSNVFCRYRIRKGNIEEGFKMSDVIVEGEYRTPVQEHAYLQPEAGLGFIDEEGRVTVIVGGQWTHEDQEQIAHALALPLDKVRVIYPAIGGAFGGREDMSVQVILGLAAWRLSERGINRPVKIIWSREESIIGHHKRHAYVIRSKWGATKEGKIIAAQNEIVADGGAYIYTSTKVLGNATLMVTGPYDIPNVNVDSYAVYTNNIPGGAFRGFGGPQGAFAAELQVSKLAEKLGLDPVEIRMRNLFVEGSELSVGSPLPKGVSIRMVVEECAKKAGWVLSKNGWVFSKSEAVNRAGDNLRRGMGFACAYKNVGFSFGAPEQCQATIELFGKAEIEKAVLYHAGAEVGQGSHTVFTQMAAQALGVPIERVHLVSSDTSVTGNSGSVSASRMTFMAGNAIIGAAKEALKNWENEERPARAHYQYLPPRTTPYDPENGKCEPNFAYGYVAEAIDVEVDVETGEIRLLNVICADDVGQAINPQLVQGQVEGAVVQAAGYSLLENFIQKDGQTLTKAFSTYLIPTVLDIPGNVDSIILESADSIGPWGARGMGEMPYLPFAPAVVAAVKSATGFWFDDFPLLPEKVVSRIGGAT